MNNLQKLTSRSLPSFCNIRMSSGLGDLGSGAGKGGGGGGSIREAGGSFGKMEAAHEEEYFYKQTRKLLEDLKDRSKREVTFHEQQIRNHQEAILRHKQKGAEIDQHSSQ